MKKVITICLLVATLLVGGLTADAKTTKKKSKAKNNPTVIGKFKFDDTTLSLLSNGRIKSTEKCYDGSSYEKIKGAYKVYLSPYDQVFCGYWLRTLVIVGDYVYFINGSTDVSTIHDFTYNPSNKTVTIINTSGMSDREFMEYNSLPSMTVPLSHFRREGNVTWIKKKR